MSWGDDFSFGFGRLWRDLMDPAGLTERKRGWYTKPKPKEPEPQKPKLTAEDICFLRDMKVGL